MRASTVLVSLPFAAYLPAAATLIDNDPEEPDFRRLPKVVAAPQGKVPDVPKGFAVQVFARGLKHPRVIRIAPNGDIFVAESGSGRVLVFPANAAEGAPADEGTKARLAGLELGLGRLGWFDPEIPSITASWAKRRGTRSLAKELVALQDLILCMASPATRALQQETQTIPIVFVGHRADGARPVLACGCAASVHWMEGR